MTAAAARVSCGLGSPDLLALRLDLEERASYDESNRNQIAHLGGCI